MRYQKPSTTIQEQIAIMRNRGLIVSDEGYAKQHLEFIGYFRLAGYALPQMHAPIIQDLLIADGAT